MHIKIFQIFYDLNQTPNLDSGFIPYYNSSASTIYENEVIKSIYLNKQYSEADYVGTTSWRITKKTGLTFKKIKHQIEKSNADIYLYGNVTGFPFISNALRRNRFNYSGQIISKAYESGIFKFQNPKLNWVTVFCNYWICKPHIYEKYCTEFLLPFNQFLSEDPLAKKLLNEGYQMHRNIQYPRHAFVYEFLFGLFTYHYLSQFKIEEIPFDMHNTDTKNIHTTPPDVSDMATLTITKNRTLKAIPASSHPEGLPGKTKKIIGFYHILAVNNWIDLVTEHLEMLLQSGLYDAAEKIYVGFNGGAEGLYTFQRLISQFPKINIAEVSGNASDYEFTTLKLMAKEANSDDFYGFYIHTKGVTSDVSRNTVNVKSWRDCLNHYIIKRWAWNIEQLNKGYNTSGVQYKDFIKGFPPHYSGNYFWFDSPVIKTLTELTPQFCSDRFNAERWLSTSESWMPANFKTVLQFIDNSSFLPTTKLYRETDFINYEIKTGVVFENPDYKATIDTACQKLKTLNVKTAIDIGSGTGVLVNLMNSQYGIDTSGIDPNLLHYIYATDPVRCDTSLAAKYRIGNLDNITDYADVYIAIDVFEYIDHRKVKAFLSKAARRCQYFYFSSTSTTREETIDISWGRINVKPVASWIKLFDECGFEVHEFPKTPTAWSIIFKSKPFKQVS